MEVMSDVYSKCGVICTRCPWSRSVRETMESEEAFNQYRQQCRAILGYSPSDNVFRDCVGCQTPDDEIPKGDRIPLKSCLARRCVERIGIQNCSYCGRFPCGFIREHGTVWTREKIEARHGASISEQDYYTYVEPFEGFKHLEAIHATLDRDQIVEDVTVPPLKTRIVDFPEELPLSQEERSGYQTIHQLLTAIKRSSLGLEDTDTFAQQQRLKKRIPFFLRFLWIFGLFGDFEEDKAGLVVDPEIYISNRGSQASLADWNYLSITVIKILADNGVHAKLIPLEKGWKTPGGYLRKNGWEMVTAFDEQIGGVKTIKSLQVYTRKLDEEYGKRGFRYFSNADMRILL